MKNNLENIFKEKLQNYEVPYNPKAWEALSPKIGVPSPPSGLRTTLKWAVAGVTFIGFAIFILSPKSKTETRTVNHQETEIENISSSTTQVTEKNLVSTQNETKIEVIEQNSIQLGDDKPIVNNNTPIAETVNTNVDIVSEENTDGSTIRLDNQTHTPNYKTGTPIFKHPSKSYITGELSAFEICKGEVLTISNKGTENEIVYYIGTDEFGGILDKGELSSGEKTSIKVNENTLISFVNERGETIGKSSVKVIEMPGVGFTFEANIFEDGLPVVNFSALGNFKSYKWNFDEKGESTTQSAVFNFFDKGDYDVKLTVQDNNGCKAQTSQVVNIRENYNLMAVDAFIPNGTDPRNRTFMPYSLTQRDVKFNLTIVDPITKEVVFTSDNAANQWDGINQRTGKMTASEKAFVWKVQIYNPLPNERPVYSGTIMHN